ncbi:MAG: amidohydrolase family protein [Bacillota bacterium]|jgi:predicted TIM-barrel fold metal-dependent hydrolase
MYICDAHLHYGYRDEVERISRTSPLREQFPCYTSVQFDTMDDCECLLKEHGVGKTALVPFVFREQDAREESLRVVEFARKDPQHRFPYALLDESDPGFVDKYRNELVGVKEHVVRNRSVLTDAKCCIFEQLRDYGMTLLLHSEGSRRVEYVSAIVGRFPGMKIQIAHMGRGKPGDLALIYEIMERFRDFETVTFDTSTVRDKAALEYAVNKVGADRILYGSDFPFAMGNAGEDIMGEEIRQVVEARLTDDQREKILSRNFERLITKGGR